MYLQTVGRKKISQYSTAMPVEMFFPSSATPMPTNFLFLPSLTLALQLGLQFLDENAPSRRPHPRDRRFTFDEDRALVKSEKEF